MSRTREESLLKWVLEKPAEERAAFLPGGVTPAAGLRNPAPIHFRDRNPIGAIGDGRLEYYSG